MHALAKEWDLKYSHLVKFHEVVDGKYVPKNRPCDWCGEKVDLGTIHPDCEKAEAATVEEFRG